MLQFSKLTVQQLERAVAIKTQIEALQQQLDAIGEAEGSIVVRKRGRPAKKVSAESAASEPVAKKGKKRTITPEHRAKLAEAAKARWAKAKAAKKTRL